MSTGSQTSDNFVPLPDALMAAQPEDVELKGKSQGKTRPRANARAVLIKEDEFARYAAETFQLLVAEACDPTNDSARTLQHRLTQGCKTFYSTELAQASKKGEAGVFSIKLAAAGVGIGLVALTAVAGPFAPAVLASGVLVSGLAKFGAGKWKDYQKNKARKALRELNSTEIKNISQDADKTLPAADQSKIATLHFDDIAAAKAVSMTWWKHVSNHEFFASYFLNPTIKKKFAAKTPFSSLPTKEAALLKIVGDGLRVELVGGELKTTYCSFVPRDLASIAKGSSSKSRKASALKTSIAAKFKGQTGKKLPEAKELQGAEFAKFCASAVSDDLKKAQLFKALTVYGKTSYNFRVGLYKVVYYTALLADCAKDWRAALNEIETAWRNLEEEIVQLITTQMWPDPRNHAHCDAACYMGTFYTNLAGSSGDAPASSGKTPPDGFKLLQVKQKKPKFVESEFVDPLVGKVKKKAVKGATKAVGKAAGVTKKAASATSKITADEISDISAETLQKMAIGVAENADVASAAVSKGVGAVAGYFVDVAAGWVIRHFKVKIPARRHAAAAIGFEAALESKLNKTPTNDELAEEQMAQQKGTGDGLFNGAELQQAVIKLAHYYDKITTHAKNLSDDLGKLKASESGRKTGGPSVFASCTEVTAMMKSFAYLRSQIYKMSFFVRYLEYTVNASQWVVRQFESEMKSTHLTVLNGVLADGGKKANEVDVLERQLANLSQMAQGIEDFTSMLKTMPSLAVAEK